MTEQAEYDKKERIEKEGGKERNESDNIIISLMLSYIYIPVIYYVQRESDAIVSTMFVHVHVFVRTGTVKIYI